MKNSKIQTNKKCFLARTTAMIKGIAIIMMVCNHFFPIPDWIYSSNQFWSVPVGSKTIAAYIGGFSKACVGIYTLLAGIGVYHKYRQFGMWGGINIHLES